MAFSSLLNPVLNPILIINPAISILLLSFIISLGITVIYKLTTNQDLMKQLKSEMKEFQKEIKMLKANPQKAMAVQKRAMETNMKYMMHSMKSTLFTILPIILIFGWMNANLAYEPIAPGEEFTVTAYFMDIYDGEVFIEIPDGITSLSEQTKTVKDGIASWTLQGDAGEYLLGFGFGKKYVTKDVIISERKAYSPIEERYSKSELKKVVNGNKPLKPLGTLSIFGWHPGWLGYYIILSIIFSMLLRKVMKVY